MSIHIDPELLQSIAQEARQCFLEEDAPGYLATLQEQLQTEVAIDYPLVLRAAHSLKGGAGLAQMPHLSELAHKLEDVLQAYRDKLLSPSGQTQAWQLIQQGLAEIELVLDQAAGETNPAVDRQLLRDLQEVLTHPKVVTADPNLQRETTAFKAPAAMVRSALSIDLEDCLQRATTSLQKHSRDQQVSTLETLVEECSLLGETLALPWLQASANALGLLLETRTPQQPLTDLALEVIQHIRQQRQLFLEGGEESRSGESHLEIQVDSQPEVSVSPDPETGEGVTEPGPTSGSLRTQIPHVRIPLSRVDSMADQVGELIVRFERFSLQQQQLRQSSQELQRLSLQFQPLRDQVQLLYDQFSTQPTAEDGSAPSEADFDPLELDRYTALHTSLQNFEELITRIQETRADVDLVTRELTEDLELGRQELDSLYNNVTRSRLIPFQTLAQRFLLQVQRLAQRFGKQTGLEIEGGDTLVDQVILEQLQTPLTHLLNNALDHGIEPPEERKRLDKPPTAQILLKAELEGNQVVITFRDDGRGIDLERVYHKAVAAGLCSASISMSQLRREQILGFIFQSGFSTATQVSEISGRGVGLDVVNRQVTQLRGSLQVDSQPGQSTTFTVRLPLGLNLLPLMLCQSQRHLIALPATSVLEIFPYREIAEQLQPQEASHAPQQFEWRHRRIPLLPLARLLPYADTYTELRQPRVVIVVNSAETPVAVSIDTLIGERQLILKPFDETISVPPYVAGCTILGTGDVVPVVLPFHFGFLLDSSKPSTSRGMLPSRRTILIAEDSVATRRALERILEEAGYTTIACRDGQEALDELRQRQGAVDLVLSDIEMPRLTGFELLQTIRAHSEWFALPVAFLTSRTGERHREKALSLGATTYFNKPVDPKSLVEEVGTLLSAEIRPSGSPVPQSLLLQRM
ncbi:MAG: response regulator [Synechococcaceae cyanobacterium SM2_3_1]|nr:response regulator [Synechococcaceae cyanobacterium SM2_3_1]